MTVEIHPAHGQAVQARAQLLQAAYERFMALRLEDERHIGALLAERGLDPLAFAQYGLRTQDGRWFLELHEKQQAPAAAVMEQAVNGALQPAAS